MGTRIGFTWFYFHGLTATTSFSRHTHAHTHTLNPAPRKAQVISTKRKNTHPILIKWISSSAFLPSYLSDGCDWTSEPADNATPCTPRQRLTLTHSGRPFHARPVQAWGLGGCANESGLHGNRTSLNPPRFILQPIHWSKFIPGEWWFDVKPSHRRKQIIWIPPHLVCALD